MSAHFLLLLASSLSAGVQSTLPADFERVVQAELTHAGSTSAVRGKTIADAYEQLHSGAHASGLDALSDSDLDLLLRAARKLQIYRPQERIERDMAAVVDVLVRRGALSTAHLETWFDAAMATRNFATATSILLAHPRIGRRPPPKVMDAAIHVEGVPVYALADDGRSLLRSHIPAQSGRWLVVVSSPGCGFSTRAANDLHASRIFRERLAERDVSTAWLQPVEKTFDIAGARRWRDRHPDFPLYWASAQHDWPQLETWDTPGFYLFQEGHLIGAASGWHDTRDGIQAVLSLLDQIPTRPPPF
jgi:hypothetical protein